MPIYALWIEIAHNCYWPFIFNLKRWFLDITVLVREPTMTKSLFVFKRSAEQIVRNPSVSGIIIFALTVSCFSALILTAAAADRYVDLQNTIEMKKMWLIGDITASEENGSYPLFDRLFSDDFPEIDSFVSLEASAPDGRKINLIYSGEEDSSLDPIEMAEGRNYTDSELKNGDFVAVVNVTECEGFDLGDAIKIGGADFEIIGKTYGQTTVPLFAAMREGWPIKVGDIVFSDFLTEEQESLFRSIISDISKNQNITVTVGDGGITTHFELFGKSNYDSIKRGVYALLVLLAMSAVIIAEIFGYSVTCRLREFNIYKTLGAQEAELFAIFYLPPIIMLAVSLILGGALFKLSYPARRLLGITNGFTPTVAAIAVLTIIILMILATLPRYIKILRQDPKDGEGLT